MMELRPSVIQAAVSGTWVRSPATDHPVDGVSIDSREAQDGKLFVAIRGETHDGHAFAVDAARGGARVIMVEQDVHRDALPASVGVLRVASTRRALLELAGRFRASFTDTNVIAVTGSAGKTTTRQLVFSTLSAAQPCFASPKSFNNDIGVPLSLLAVRPHHRHAVIEVGINAVGEMQPLAEIVRPDVAVITNVGDSHLEGLHDVATVAREKLRLVGARSPTGVAVLHADSPALRSAAGALPNIIWFGESQDADVRLTSAGRDDRGSWLETADRARFRLGLPGRHNAVNALAAIAIGRHLGMSDAVISAGLERATAAPMRMEMACIADMLVVNDAYNANPQSMVAGVEAFLDISKSADRRVFVLGDMCELGAAGPGLHESVGRTIGAKLAREGRSVIFFVGELASTHLMNGLRGVAPFECAVFSAMDGGTADDIARMLQPGDAVFIKGSRAMALERLVASLRRHDEPGAPGDRKQDAGARENVTADTAP